MSLVLAFGAFQGIVVAFLLTLSRKNRGANGLLAVLLLVTVLRILPFALGYAGFYDLYPWLSFAPYNLGFAFGPLVFLYIVTLTNGELPGRWWLHLVPAAIEALYYCVIFPQSLGFKQSWDARVQEPLIAPLEQAFTLLSALIYAVAAIRRYRVYQRWLADTVSYRDEFRLTWVRNFLIAFSSVLSLWVGFAGFEHWVRPLNYFNEFPLYVAFTLFVYYLGLEGWRNADVRYPVPKSMGFAAISPTEEPVGVPELPAEPIVSDRDWKAQGAAWLQEVQRRELWREADLSAAMLARELGTNTAYLSRALNEGLGQSFNECINRMRVSEVERRLRDRSDDVELLTIALDSGFRSKASFNRAFKAYTQQTPSEYRTKGSISTSQIVKS